MHKLDGYRHLPGAHCASTALNNVSRFYGHALTEPLCLGLAEGLSFISIDLPGSSPSHLLMGRSRYLEQRFFENIGVPFQWREGDDARSAWQAVRASIDRNVPVLLRTDLHFLSYYNSRTHFSGHVVVLVGYDETVGNALLSDTHFETLQTVDLEALDAARSSSDGITPLRYHAFAVKPFDLPSDLGKLARRALAHQARHLLEVRETGPAKFGVAGMEHLARTFSSWREAPDWKWCARYAYQMIEKRGTGGGNFRRLYAGFLSEAASWLPGLDLAGRAERMTEIADRWTALADHLRAISESEAPEGFEEAGRMMGGIAELERVFFTETAALS
jgi:hypothetical protein